MSDAPRTGAPHSESTRSDYSARSITWRSLLIGTIAVLAICILTPLNDFIFSNTSLCSGYMPLGATLVLFLLVVVINAPLHRWFPKHALSGGEMAVIVLMALVSCSLPNWGLMRFFIPTPVAPFHVGAADSAFWKAFTGMNLPHWLFPVPDPKTGRSSPIVLWFYDSIPPDGSIPWRAWTIPILVWGIFAAAMFATLVSIARLVIDQWAENERLPFPLVQVQAALIEPPAPGHSFNAMFRSPVLWIGLCGALGIHLLSVLNTYFPRHFPQIPLSFDLSGLLSEEPFIYLQPRLKASTVYFTLVGVTFFVRSRAAFSLWATFIIINIVDMIRGMQQAEMPSQAWQDQHLGATIAFAGGILWIGRHHWLKVLRNAFGAQPGAGYRSSFWIAITGILVMCGWLRVVGVQWHMAMLIVLFIITAHLIVSRVVAETGLPFFRSGIAVSQIYSNSPTSWWNMRDIFFASIFSVLGPLTTRDSVTTYATTGIGIAKEANVESPHKRPLGAVIALALLIGFFASAYTTLYCQYTYPTPADRTAPPGRNNFGADYIPKRDVAPGIKYFADKRYVPKTQNSFLHIGIGFVVTVILEIFSLRWASWPFLPVGYVASYGAFVDSAWFSIFLGWLAQVLIVKFGGSSLFQKAKPFFVGIIFGEGLAAAIWLAVNAIIVMHGGNSQSVKFLL